MRGCVSGFSTVFGVIGPKIVAKDVIYCVAFNAFWYKQKKQLPP